MNLKKLIVFDMDGVMIDVSGSYREAVRHCARLFFKPAQFWQDLPNPLFPLEDLAELKQRGGLNNDWDLTFLVINLLFTRVIMPKIDFPPKGKKDYKKAISLLNVSPLSSFLKSTKSPLITLLKEKGEINDPFIESMYTKDVGKGNIIKQIFQEIYLGEKLFQSIYNIPSEFSQLAKGLINNEKLLIDTDILKKLSQDNILAVATGRPKAEADYTLSLFDLKKYFKIVLTLDHCLYEEKRRAEKSGPGPLHKQGLSKPHPFMLDAIASHVKDEKISTCFYIGDMPDDILAASRSKSGFKSLGFIACAPNKGALKAKLLEVGAEYIIEDFNELLTII